MNSTFILCYSHPYPHKVDRQTNLKLLFTGTVAFYLPFITSVWTALIAGRIMTEQRKNSKNTEFRGTKLGDDE